MGKKYSQIQAEWYDQSPVLTPWPELLAKYGLNRLYKPREIFWKKELKKLRIKKGEKMLEVGCGKGGWLVRLMKQYKIEGVGVDVSKKSIEQALKWGQGSFKVQDGTKLTFKDNSFDVVVSFDVLEHIENQKKAVFEMARLLKPGGRLLIYTLNKNDKYSLDWWWEKLGIDIYKRAAHKRELFVDSDWLVKELAKNDVKVYSVSYFDGFFTLLLDETIMAVIWVLDKLKLTNSKILGRVCLLFLSNISKTFYPFLNFADRLWYKKGRSLSFSVVGRKEK